MANQSHSERVEQLLAQDPASGLLGITIVKTDSGYCELSIMVTNQMTNGYDLCYGGFIYSLADTAMAFACAKTDADSVTASAQIEFLKPARLQDQLIATAKLNQQSGRNQYCDVEVKNQHGEVVAILRGRQKIVKSS